MTSTRSWLCAALCAVLAAGAAAYLYDPPWVGRVTEGLQEWETDSSGARYRWTTGHAAFFVPREAIAVMLPLRAGQAGPGGSAVTVAVSVDDRWLADIVLRDPQAWVRSTLPLPRRPTRRHYRRIDLRVNRTAGPSMHGVEVGDVELDRLESAR
jgi:hypothetical protein